MLEDPGVHVICKKTTEEICRISQISKNPCVSFLKHPVHNIRLLVKTKQTKNTAMITVWPEPLWKKVKTSQLLLPQHQSTYPRDPESASIEIPPFSFQGILQKV